jgi:hypothetical protein
MLQNRRFTYQGHVHSFVITQDLVGWDVVEEEDREVLRHVHRGDWQRVEREALLFANRAASLTLNGWTEE